MACVRVHSLCAVGMMGFVAARLRRVIKKGLLKKLGGKAKDKWQDREVHLSASQITWDKGGLQATDISAVAVWSGLGMPEGYGFEIASRIKGGKVYKFVAATEQERGSWMDAIGGLIGDSGAAANLVSENSVHALQSITLDGRVLAAEGESENELGLGETVAPTMVVQTKTQGEGGIDLLEL